MAKLQLKNKFLICAAIFALLVSPVLAISCGCDSHFVFENVAQNPQSSDEGDCHSAGHQADEEKSTNECDSAVNSGDCCCLKNAPAKPLASEKKSFHSDNFDSLISTPQIEFVLAARFQSADFNYHQIFYPARSALSDKPSRAPPRL